MADTSQQAGAQRTDVGEFITDLDAGVFEQRIGVALSHVAAATMDNGGSGEVVVKFQFKRIDGTAQIKCAHSMKFTSPTTTGKASEESGGATVLHVNKGGKLSLVPDSQMSFLDKQGVLKS